MTTLTLPWPLTVNRHFIHSGPRATLSRAAREYRAAAVTACLEQAAPRLGTARVRLTITAHPPDRRRRDLDNLTKGLLDALTFARVIDDDEQIDDLRIIRSDPRKPGRVTVTLEVIP